MPDAVATPSPYDWDPESPYILTVRPGETIHAAKVRKMAESRLPAKTPPPWPRCGTVDGDPERMGKCYRSGTRPLPFDGAIVHLCTPHAEAMLDDPEYSPTEALPAEPDPPRHTRTTERAWEESKGLDPDMPRSKMPSRIDRSAEYARRNRARHRQRTEARGA